MLTLAHIEPLSTKINLAKNTKGGCHKFRDTDTARDRTETECGKQARPPPAWFLSSILPGSFPSSWYSWCGPPTPQSVLRRERKQLSAIHAALTVSRGYRAKLLRSKTGRCFSMSWQVKYGKHTWLHTHAHTYLWTSGSFPMSFTSSRYFACNLPLTVFFIQTLNTWEHLAYIEKNTQARLQVAPSGIDRFHITCVYACVWLRMWRVLVVRSCLLRAQ